MSTAVGDTFGK